ncbi:MAG: exopolysaccharide biosynthesis protein [Arenicella sp.]
MSIATSFQPLNIKTSILLSELLCEIPDENVDFGHFLGQFKERSYAGILLIFAVLYLLPGISVLAGLLMIYPSIQLLFGFKTPVFPAFIHRKRIQAKHLKSIGSRVVPKVEWLELFVKTRWLLMSSKMAQRFLGLVMLVLAIIVAIPFPLSNYLPAFAMFFIGIGMLERDGIFISIGLGVSFIAIAVSGAIVTLVHSWFIYFFM